MFPIQDLALERPAASLSAVWPVTVLSEGMEVPPQEADSISATATAQMPGPEMKAAGSTVSKMEALTETLLHYERRNVPCEELKFSL